MARDYRREYERRQERAKQRGWQSYSQQRHATAVVKASDVWTYYSDGGYIPEGRSEQDEVIKAMYFMMKEGDRDYGPDSWHYYLFVDLLDYMSADEWEGAYPNGARTYGIHR